jgi:hypothetical protein
MLDDFRDGALGEGLFQEVHGAHLHGTHRQLHVGMSGDDYDRKAASQQAAEPDLCAKAAL